MATAAGEPNARSPFLGVTAADASPRRAASREGVFESGGITAAAPFSLPWPLWASLRGVTISETAAKAAATALTLSPASPGPFLNFACAAAIVDRACLDRCTLSWSRRFAARRLDESRPMLLRASFWGEARSVDAGVAPAFGATAVGVSAAAGAGVGAGDGLG